jgi:hypothetical protein
MTMVPRNVSDHLEKYGGEMGLQWLLVRGHAWNWWLDKMSKLCDIHVFLNFNNSDKTIGHPNWCSLCYMTQNSMSWESRTPRLKCRVNKERVKCYKTTLHVLSNKQCSVLCGKVYFKFHNTPQIKTMQNICHVHLILFYTVNTECKIQISIFPELLKP